ncbi:MAG: hypothetical protein ACLP59_02230 [Bryobacteraceae bacterium]
MKNGHAIVAGSRMTARACRENTGCVVALKKPLNLLADGHIRFIGKIQMLIQKGSALFRR